jgi:hypothetical protein
MIDVDESLPKMSASSAVSPTVREDEAAVALGYYVAGDGASAVVRFRGVRDWTYGYPNDEGLDAHPLHGLGLTYYEFHVTPVAAHEERAWIATFHDGTFTVYADAVEVLADDFPGHPSHALDAVLGKGETGCSTVDSIRLTRGCNGPRRHCVPIAADEPQGR